MEVQIKIYDIVFHLEQSQLRFHEIRLRPDYYTAVRIFKTALPWHRLENKYLID